MLKIVVGIAIVAFTSYCGFLLSKKYRRRKRFFADFDEFNERFLSEIAYLRRPLRQFADNARYQSEFGDVLEAYFSSQEDGKPFEIGDFSLLKTDERQELLDYFSMLGRGDSASQKGYFTSVKNSLKARREQSDQEAKKYGELYIKLGFLLGLTVLIIIL